MLLPFKSITLEGIACARLPNRVESKFILNESLLPKLLEALSDAYYCLEIGSRRAFSYSTNYFDTSELTLYKDHHNGYLKRLKVRCRLYEETGDCYFELKKKQNELRTEKVRTLVPGMKDFLQAEDYAAIQYSHIEGQKLYWQLNNSFRRITLCNHAFNERITIDTGVQMHSAHASKMLNHLAVIEVKQDKLRNDSPAIAALKHAKAIATPFSKYALGMALLHPAIKQNNFKPVLSLLKKHSYA